MVHLVKKIFMPVLVISLLLPAMVFANGSEDLHAKLHAKGNHLTGTAEVVSVLDSGLTVKGKGETLYTLLVNADSKLRYRGGLALLSDFQVGDYVKLKAKKDGEGNYVVRHLMNVSLKRVAIHGKVANLSVPNMSFDVQTNKRGTFAVIVSGDTEFRFDDEDHAPGSFADLANDLEVTVKGRLHMPTMSISQVKFVVIHTGEDGE